MKNYLAPAIATVALTGSAFAGGVERTAQSVSPIFEVGNYGELSFGYVSPDVSGTVGGGAAASGNMTEGYFQFGGAYKHQFNDQLSFALIFDQPFGADVDYPAAAAPYPFAGSTAELNTNALTGIVRYKLANNFSVHGGLRYQTFNAEASIPVIAGYSGVGSTDGAFGYLVGAAYERPDIALRVALTYNSEIEHNFDTVESAGGGAGVSSVTSTTTPQSINLDFQTGVAADTLVFGSIRWVDWSEFEIAPVVYVGTVGSPLVSFDDDTVTYTIGVGRRFNETWSGSVSLIHEPSNGGFQSNLGPTDGKTGVTLGVRYKRDNMTISGGINYTFIGDAETLAGAAGVSDFSDNHAWGAGIRVGYNF